MTGEQCRKLSPGYYYSVISIKLSEAIQQIHLSSQMI